MALLVRHFEGKLVSLDKRLPWFGTSFGLTARLFKFWQAAPVSQRQRADCN